MQRRLHPWKAMPKQFGSGSAIHAYFQEWVQLGVFEELWQLALSEYDELKGIDWKWQSMDGAMTKSPLGGEKNREKPDRSWQARRQTLDADRWPRPWTVPMCLTRSWLVRRSTTFPSSVLNRRRKSRSIFASTRDMLGNPL